MVLKAIKLRFFSSTLLLLLLCCPREDNGQPLVLSLFLALHYLSLSIVVHLLHSSLSSANCIKQEEDEEEKMVKILYPTMEGKNWEQSDHRLSSRNRRPTRESLAWAMLPPRLRLWVRLDVFRGRVSVRPANERDTTWDQDLGLTGVSARL